MHYTAIEVFDEIVQRLPQFVISAGFEQSWRQAIVQFRQERPIPANFEVWEGEVRALASVQVQLLDGNPAEWALVLCLGALQRTRDLLDARDQAAATEAVSTALRLVQEFVDLAPQFHERTKLTRALTAKRNGNARAQKYVPSRTALVIGAFERNASLPNPKRFADKRDAMDFVINELKREWTFRIDLLKIDNLDRWLARTAKQDEGLSIRLKSLTGLDWR